MNSINHSILLHSELQSFTDWHCVIYENNVKKHKNLIKSRKYGRNNRLKVSYVTMISWYFCLEICTTNERVFSFFKMRNSKKKKQKQRHTEERPHHAWFDEIGVFHFWSAIRYGFLFYSMLKYIKTIKINSSNSKIWQQHWRQQHEKNVKKKYS